MKLVMLDCDMFNTELKLDTIEERKALFKRALLEELYFKGGIPTVWWNGGTIYPTICVERTADELTVKRLMARAWLSVYGDLFDFLSYIRYLKNIGEWES